jgi:1-aminocyclopropane-1-carboxylate deaminase/D-cysteine desulfhydrase-like pyridoxal-dependent ACC family enzyme
LKNYLFIFAGQKYYKPLVLPEMLFDISKAHLEELTDELFLQKQVGVWVLRLDKIHPTLSGNKIFKLHYFLKEALASAHPAGARGKTVLTFGGAYSNHMAATAFACKTLDLKSLGIVWGEKPAQLSPTLQQCVDDGMQLKFIARTDYDKKEEQFFLQDLQAEFGDCIIIPEGGFHPLGAKGAALIYGLVRDKSFTHICTASGTATTLAGLLDAAQPAQTIISIPVLKGMEDINKRLNFLTGCSSLPQNLQIVSGYHFGGYAKKTPELLQFMNHCWLQYQLPLDFVYTAKMMFAVIDLVKNDHFPRGSQILCLHTGGLQGNKSLPLNSLLF